MKIEKSFTLPHSPERVWDGLSDVAVVAECLPGAQLLEALGEDRYKGRFSVRLGPLAAAFDGEAAIERRPQEQVAVVSGKGSDSRSSSRASGGMTYRLFSEEGGQATRVEVVAEIALTGALAQFGKSGVMQEVANRITAQFVENFGAHLADTAPQVGSQEGAAGAARSDAIEGSGTVPDAPDAAPSARSATREAGEAGRNAAQLDAGSLIWGILRDRIAGLFRRLFGRGR